MSSEITVEGEITTFLIPRIPAGTDALHKTQRKFIHKGIEVLEIIYRDFYPGVDKLGWIRSPMTQPTLNDSKGCPARNDLCHCNFNRNPIPADMGNVTEKEAREKVKKEFEEHWFS